MNAASLSATPGRRGPTTGPHDSQERDMRNAVEASVSRAKALGATSNLYIVEGDDHAYAHGSNDGQTEGFAISTRSDTHPTRVGYLFPTEHTIETLWPRPSVGRGWSQGADGLWSKR
jgi:hypothetical protein